MAPPIPTGPHVRRSASLEPAVEPWTYVLTEPARQVDDDTLDIMAWTMLGEAANQGREGLAAIAHVALNRAESGRYSSDLKKVLLQSSGGGVHQFSAWNSTALDGNDPKKRYPKSSSVFKAARAVAEDVLAGRIPDPTGGATHYWAPKGMKGGKDPYWANSEETNGRLRIGDHVFLPRHPVPPMNIPEVGTAIDAIDRASPSPMARSTALAYARPPALPPLSDNLRPLKFDQPIPPRGIDALRAADPVVRGVDQFSRDVGSDITPGFDSLMPFATRDGATNARMRAMASPTAADMAPRPASVRPIPTIGAQGTPGTPPRLPEPMAAKSAAIPPIGMQGTPGTRARWSYPPSDDNAASVDKQDRYRPSPIPIPDPMVADLPVSSTGFQPAPYIPGGYYAKLDPMKNPGAMMTETRTKSHTLPQTASVQPRGPMRDIPVPDEGGKYKLIPPLEQYVRAPSPGLRSTALAAARPAPSASSSPMLRSAALASLRAPSLPPKMAPTASPMMRPSTVAFMATPSPGLTSGGGGGGPVTSSDWHRSIFG